MSGITKIGQSSSFTGKFSFFCLFRKANSPGFCFCQQKRSFLRQARDQSMAVSLLWWDAVDSPCLPLWKGKPISCPHDVSIIIWPSLPVVTGQGSAPRGSLLNSPCLLAWFTANNDGYTEDYFTRGHRMAGALPTLYPTLADSKSASSYRARRVVLSRCSSCCLLNILCHIVSNLHAKCQKLFRIHMDVFLVIHLRKKSGSLERTWMWSCRSMTTDRPGLLLLSHCASQWVEFHGPDANARHNSLLYNTNTQRSGPDQNAISLVWSFRHSVHTGFYLLTSFIKVEWAIWLAAWVLFLILIQLQNHHNFFFRSCSYTLTAQNPTRFTQVHCYGKTFEQNVPIAILQS